MRSAMHISPLKATTTLVVSEYVRTPAVVLKIEIEEGAPPDLKRDRVLLDRYPNAVASRLGLRSVLSRPLRTAFTKVL